MIYDSLRFEIEEREKWNVWVNQIPYLSFSPLWVVKIIPPYGAVLVRFIIRTKNMPNNTCITVVLDRYSNFEEIDPFWEVYPCAEGGTFRCDMHQTQRLMDAIEKAIRATFVYQIKPG